MTAAATYSHLSRRRDSHTDLESEPAPLRRAGRRLFAAAPHGVFMSVENADHLNLRGMRDTEILDLVINGYPPEPTPQSEPVGSPDPLETGAA